MSQYVLGTDELELARLRLQQEVWGGITERFLDRLRMPREARVLDLGCGPGFVLESLHSRLGHTGHITALDESPVWLAHVSRHAAERGWTNVRLVQKRIEELELPPESLDVIFARWVLSFLPDTRAVVGRLARLLKPHGVLAVQDYNHEGISLFPESDGFRAVVRATRALYASKGGDTWVAARLPGAFRQAGLELFDYSPHVLCGGPTSPAFRWADAFFPHHSENMVRAGVLTAEEREQFLREWAERKSNPEAVFFSPMVVDVAGRKRGAR
jgi:SAM-dependent methyltransferase